MVTHWDPIDEALSPEVVSATIKRQIRNILKSYTGWFDPLAELIQNAIDAVEHRKQREKNYQPNIWIKIDLKEGLVCVTDNGVGFKEDEFRTFLAPNVSFKKHNDRGNKGVGATYLAYGFNFLQIGTKNPDFSLIGTIKDGREWVEDEEGIIIRPRIQEDKPIHEAFDDVDRGSSVVLKLVGEYIRPKDLKWVGANNAEQWRVVLHLKTALGGIYLNNSPIPLMCSLTVIDEAGNTTNLEYSTCEYVYPHTVFSACKKMDDVIKTQEGLLAKGKDGTKLPQNYYKLNGLYNSWTYKNIISAPSTLRGDWSTKEKQLAERYKISIYGFFGYSVRLWNKYNDEIVGLRKGARILRGGIQLATNCMPQGELIPIPLTRNIGYQNQTHVIVQFDQAEPDLGRKGFQPELTELAQHIGISVVNSLSAWKRLLQKDTGAPPNITEIKQIHDWVVEQEEHEKNYPLIISRKDLFLPTKEPSITSIPTSEQDVIALFNQLLAGGVIRGLKLMATSQHQQYDGILRLCLSKPFANHLYDKEKNPLGLDPTNVNGEYLGSPQIIEYKFSFDGLVNEIESEDKREKHVELIVAWEMGESWKTRYEITPLLYFGNIQHRYFHGGTHIVRDSTSGEAVFPAIILSELIDYINGPDEVQDYQKDTYIEV